MAEQVQRKKMNSTIVSKGIVHLHWIAYMTDFKSFFQSIPDSSPIVWTLHDMNPITGGCHYSGGCDKFESGCGNCPQVVAPNSFDVSRSGFRYKQSALKNKDLTVVAPSQWLLTLAQNSLMFPAGTTFHHIKLGFDLQQLLPMNKREARAKLGIDVDAPLIGFGAESINNRRKGFDLLLSALSELEQRQKFECAVFGSGDLQSELGLTKIHSLGFLNDAEKLRQFYSACDLVVVPSREDNQPQIGLEAMACGTPVVGFDVGGVSEYVNAGVTGRLARPNDVGDLATQIEKLIVDETGRTNMSDRCRQLMQREFDITKQAEKYIHLYDQITRSSQKLKPQKRRSA